MGAGIDVKMNYPQMEAMAKAFGKGQRQLQDTLENMKKIAKLLEDGAMLGGAGDEFVGAIRGPLTKRLQVLIRKMGEMQSDIKAAVELTRDGVSESKSRYV